MTTTANPGDQFETSFENQAEKGKPRFVVKTWHALVVGIILGCASNFFAAYTAHNMAQQGMCTAASAQTDAL